MSDKIKVLAYCDSPTVATGFGTVSRNILEAIHITGKYDITVLGINHWGDPHHFPYDIWPVGFNGENDPYGRKKVCSMIPNMEFDILFFLQDTFILDFVPPLVNHLKSKHKFKSICYYPVDGTPKKGWIENVEPVDYLVSYTKFGKDMSNKVHPNNKHGENIRIIPHGVNTNDFHPIDKAIVSQFREQYFGANNKKFIFTNVNRNQQRKDIPRTIAAFKLFKDQVSDDALLYLHMARKDQGWDLEEVCKAYNLDIRKDVVFPENFGPNKGYPLHVVNLIYNASDCIVSSTLGEGWGLSWVEAMASKTPVIMPNNTAMSDHITEDIGYLVNSGKDENLKIIIKNDNDVIRPMVDVYDMVDKMARVYNNREEATAKAEKAYEIVTSKYDWQGDIANSWRALFEEAYSSISADTKDHSIKTELF